MKQIKIKPLTFWPAFSVMLIASLLSIFNGEAFTQTTTQLVGWILNTFSWGFSLIALCCVLACMIIFFSPMGQIKIGGADAQPLLKMGNWIMVTLCTTVAAGLLFWAAAEPLYHYYGPPKGSPFDAQTPGAAKFALSTMFMHWSFTPYAIYCVPGIVFALVHHNLHKPFSIGSMIYPLFGNRVFGKTGEVIDGIALSAFSASMASSLATGIMAIIGGLALLGISKNTLTLSVVGIAITATVIASSVSGIKRGIALLSTVNTYVFFGIGIMIFVFGPTLFIMGFGLESFGVYLDNFFRKSLITGAAEGDRWAKDWTIFYFASWMAWAPLTAMFLGKIARGYTVKQFMIVNLIIPSLFACIWTSIFSGSTLFFDIQSGGMMKNILDTQGHEAVVYALLEKMPLGTLMVIGFIFATFLSYSTAANSTTDAMANLCVKGENGEHLSEEQTVGHKMVISMKLMWGVLVGVVAVAMLIFSDITGIKQLAYIGGLPALLLATGLLASLIRLMLMTDELAGRPAPSSHEDHSPLLPIGMTSALAKDQA